MVEDGSNEVYRYQMTRDPELRRQQEIDPVSGRYWVEFQSNDRPFYLDNATRTLVITFAPEGATN